MPVPAGSNFARAVITGAMATDTWSIGIWMENATGVTPTGAAMNTFATSVRTLFDTDVWSAASVPLKGLNAAAATLGSVNTYYYTGGLLASQGTSTGAAVVGTGANVAPAYVAGVVTLRTAISSRSTRGRTYLPLTAPQVNGTTLQLSSTNITGLATNYAAFLTALNGTALGGAALEVIVLSLAKQSWTNVTSVSMDSIPDTQHGRSNKFVATSVATHAV